MMTLSESTLHLDPLSSLHFLHIPKTAGTSLRTWLLDMYRESDWLPCHYLLELLEFPSAKVSTYHFFSGHLGINWYHLLPHSPHTFTFLRHPLYREISQYFYLRRTAKTLLEIPLNPFNSTYLTAITQHSLPDLCQSPEHLGYYDNLQVRYLAGIAPQSETMAIPCTAELLEVAKENLRHLFCFGICEKMQGSFMLLNYSLGLPFHRLDLKLNQSENPSFPASFSSEELDRIATANQFDLQLYQFACSLFQERFNDCFNTENQLDILTVLQENFQKKHALVPRLSQINFDFGEAILLEGWYPRFYYQPLQKWLRWAGPTSQSCIYLPLAPDQDYHLSFPIYYVMGWEILQSLSLWIEEHEIPIKMHTLHPENASPIYQIEATISKHLISRDKPYTQLTFQTAKTLPLEIPLEDKTLIQSVSFATDGLTLTAIS